MLEWPQTTGIAAQYSTGRLARLVSSSVNTLAPPKIRVLGKPSSTPRAALPRATSAGGTSPQHAAVRSLCVGSEGVVFAVSCRPSRACPLESADQSLGGHARD